MKFLLVLLLGSFAAFLGGCDSMDSVPTRVHDRFTAVPPQIRVYAADKRAVFKAAQTAVKNVGLLVGHTSFDKGVVEGYAPIRPGDATRDTRQTTMQLQLTETPEGDIQASLLVSENTEGSFPGGVSKQDLPTHSLYGLYFAALEQVLQENGAIKASAETPKVSEKP